jgi:hypothetical protein
LNAALFVSGEVLNQLARSSASLTRLIVHPAPVS